MGPLTPALSPSEGEREKSGQFAHKVRFLERGPAALFTYAHSPLHLRIRVAPGLITLSILRVISLCVA
jgi:hypothetical protein